MIADREVYYDSKIIGYLQLNRTGWRAIPRNWRSDSVRFQTVDGDEGYIQALSWLIGRHALGELKAAGAAVTTDD